MRQYDVEFYIKLAFLIYCYSIFLFKQGLETSTIDIFYFHFKYLLCGRKTNNYTIYICEDLNRVVAKSLKYCTCPNSKPNKLDVLWVECRTIQ